MKSEAATNNLGNLLLTPLHLPLQQHHIDTAINSFNIDIYDTVAWTNLINECVQIQLDIKLFRSLMQYCYIIFPTCIKFYLISIEYELQHKQYKQCELLFQQCIGKLYDIELYKLYLNYMKLMRLTPNQPEQSFSELCDVYEYCMKHMIHDINCIVIFRDYIDIIKSYVARTKVNDMSYYIDKIRSIYQRGIVESINECEALYREYDVWEHSIDKIQAPNIIQDYTDRHLRAKLVARERKKRRTTLLTQMLSRPVRNHPSTVLQRDINQLTAWKRYILYELHNQQRLDVQQLKQRIIFIYKQALIPLYHSVDMWYDYAMYIQQHDKHQNVCDIFQQACNAMPYSTLIYLLYADYLEYNRYHEDAKKIYQQLITRTEPQPYIVFHGINYRPSNELIYSIDDSSKLGYIIPDQLSWINYIRHIRRIDGVDACRRVFIDARKSIVMKSCVELYIVCALIEYITNKDSVLAGHIFKYAIQLYPQSIQLMSAYVNYLEHINDQNNMRVMLERIFVNTDTQANKSVQHSNDTTISGELHSGSELDVMWNKYIELERYTATNLSTVDAAELRRDMAYGNKLHTISNRIDRYHFNDLYPCTLAYRQLVKQTTTNIVEHGLILSHHKTQQLIDGNTTNDQIQQTNKLQYTRPDTTQMTEWNYSTITSIELDRFRVFYSTPQHPLHNSIVLLYEQLYGDYTNQPVVDINPLLASMSVIPDASQLHSITLPDLQLSYTSNNNQQLNKNKRLKSMSVSVDDDMDDSSDKVVHKVPADDIFRARRIANVAKAQVE